MRSENTAGQRRCPIAERGCSRLLSHHPHRPGSRRPWNRPWPALLPGEEDTECMSGIPEGHAHAHTNTPLRASTLLAHGHGPLGSPSHQPWRRDGGGDVGRRRTVCGRAVVAQRIKRIQAVRRWQNERAKSCRASMRECVLSPLEVLEHRENLHSASPTGSWHPACPGLGQYYVHLAWIDREGRLPVLHALQSAQHSTPKSLGLPAKRRDGAKH